MQIRHSATPKKNTAVGTWDQFLSLEM